MLRRCRDAHQPFVLFLRSFAAEIKGKREGQSIGTMMTGASKDLQDWLAFCLVERSVPIIKLFGGSDSLFSTPSFRAPRTPGFSRPMPTTGLRSCRSWYRPPRPSFFWLVTGRKVSGSNLNRSSSHHCQDRCLIVLMDPRKTFARDAGDDMETLQRAVHEFPLMSLNSMLHGRPRVPRRNRRDFDHVIEEILRHASAPSRLERSLNAGFSYLEPDYFVSDDYADTERFLWKELRRLRAVFHNTY